MWSFFRNISFMLGEIFPPNECPGLCQNRPGIQWEKNNEAQNEKYKYLKVHFFEVVLWTIILISHPKFLDSCVCNGY